MGKVATGQAGIGACCQECSSSREFWVELQGKAATPSAGIEHEEG